MEQNISDERKYKLYVYTNKVNGKKYVGQTCKTLKRRAGKNGTGYNKCTYFYNAIKKYGWDNFVPKVLYNNLSKEEADILEIETIQKLNTRNVDYGYNILIGGSGDANNKIPIVQFDFNFNYISRYDSASDAYAKTSIDRSHILDACRHKIRHAGNFIWLFEEDYINGNYNKNEIIKWIQNKRPTKGKVVQCDINMNYIALYNSMAEASRKTGFTYSNIRENCAHITKMCSGYIWMFENEYNKIKDDPEKIKSILIDINRPKNRKRRPIVQLDTNMNFVAEFDSIMKASVITNVNRANISQVCNGVYNTAGGYVWMYKNIYENLSQEKIDDIKHVYKNINKKYYVICLNTLEEFQSEEDASKYTTLLSGSGISRNINKQRASGGKHPITKEPLYWMRLIDYEDKSESEKEELKNLYYTGSFLL